MLKAVGTPPRNSSATLEKLTCFKEKRKTHLGDRKYTRATAMAA